MSRNAPNMIKFLLMPYWLWFSSKLSRIIVIRLREQNEHDRNGASIITFILFIKNVSA